MAPVPFDTDVQGNTAPSKEEELTSPQALSPILEQAQRPREAVQDGLTCAGFGVCH